MSSNEDFDLRVNQRSSDQASLPKIPKVESRIANNDAEDCSNNGS